MKGEPQPALSGSHGWFNDASPGSFPAATVGMFRPHHRKWQVRRSRLFAPRSFPRSRFISKPQAHGPPTLGSQERTSALPSGLGPRAGFHVLKMGQGFPQSHSLGQGGRGREEKMNHRSLEPQKSFHRKYSFQFVQKCWANRNQQSFSREEL